MKLILTHSALKPPGAKNCFLAPNTSTIDVLIKMAVFFFIISIAHEKFFTFHAQPQTGAYSCFNFFGGLEISADNRILSVFRIVNRTSQRPLKRGKGGPQGSNHGK